MMASIRGLATSFVLNYLTVFFLLIGLLSIDAIPLFPRTLSIDSYRFSDNIKTLSFHKASRGLDADGVHQLRSDVALLKKRSLVKRDNCFSSNKNDENNDGNTDGTNAENT